MKGLLKTLSAGSAALSLLLLSSLAFSGVEIGKEAPSFELVDSDGNKQTLEQFKGKKVILEWTNHQCPFVVKHYGSGNMQGLQKRYTDEGVVWLSIISSAEGKQGFVSGDEANELTASREAMPSKVLFDPSGTVGKTYGAKTTPHMYIIDEDGVLQYNGAIDSIPSADKADIAKAENYVDAAMAALVAGEAVSKPLTRPYGCSVKYAKG